MPARRWIFIPLEEAQKILLAHFQELREQRKHTCLTDLGIRYPAAFHSLLLHDSDGLNWLFNEGTRALSTIATNTDLRNPYQVLKDFWERKPGADYKKDVIARAAGKWIIQYGGSRLHHEIVDFCG